MQDVLKDFERRQRRVATKHRRMAQGYTTKLNKNGIFEHRPARDIRAFILRPLLGLVMGFLIMKLVFVIKLGEAAYNARLSLLEGPHWTDEAAVMLMQIDPATQYLASLIAPLF